MPIVLSGGVDGSKSIIQWDNVFMRSVITDVGTQPNHPAINAARDPSTWSSWKAVAGSASSFTANVPAGGGNRTNNTLGVAAHNLASTGASLSLQLSDDGVTWTLATGIYAPLTDEDFILHFPTLNAQYWRVNLINSNANTSVGVASLGNALIMPHAPIDSYTPLHHARKYTKMFNDSIKGQFLGNRVMAAGAETTVDYGFIPREFADGPLIPFASHYNQGGTFFYAGWPAGKPQDMGYCRASGDDETVSVEYIEGHRLANVSFGLRSYVGA